MTTALPAPAGAAALPAEVDERPPGRTAPLVAVHVLGVLLLVASYSAAAAGWARPAPFALFWAGVLPVFVGTAVFVARRAAAPRAMLAIAALGAFGTLPKLLRTPTGPLYFDELAHWRQTQELAASGVIGAPNGMLKALASFPGLHTLTASLEQLTGLSTWAVAAALIVVAHALATVGVLVLVRAVLATGAGRFCDSDRVAGLAAVVYATNPAWMFFDTQFAYETVALPLTLWALTLVVLTGRLAGSARTAALAGAVALAFTVATMHHASALVLGLVLLLAVALAAVRRSDDVAVLLLAAVGSMLAIGAWLLPSYELLMAYLGPNFTKAWTQLRGLLLPDDRVPAAGGGDGHTLFSGSAIPAYEVAAAVATPLLLIAVVGLHLLRALLASRRGEAVDARLTACWRTPSAVLLSALAGVYFATLPLLLTGAGNEVARRSWTYSWVGVAFVVAVLADRTLARAAERSRRAGARSAGARPALLVGGLVVLAVGGVAAGQNEAYRFPGQYEQGSDTRGADDELLAVAQWMATSVPRDSWITSDRYTAAFLTSYGGQRLVVPWREVPLWGWVTGAEPEARVLESVAATKVAYLVVDSRMATSQPASGFWYEKNEPADVHAAPVPAHLLRRFDCLPSTEAVFASEHFTVYRIERSRHRELTAVHVRAELRERAGPPATASSSGSWTTPSARSLRVLTSRRCP